MGNGYQVRNFEAIFRGGNNGGEVGKEGASGCTSHAFLSWVVSLGTPMRN